MTSPMRLIRSGPRWIKRTALRRLNHGILHPLELYLSPQYDVALPYKPIFILGAPRSGSTLLIQVLTDAFDFGYISNRHCRYFGAPSLIETALRPLKVRRPSDYNSTLGLSKYPWAPSECGEWWYRFFERVPSYVSIDTSDSPRIRQFRRCLARLIQAFDRPVLFKNLYVSYRLNAIARHVPEALFIILERDEVDVGHSLLESRKKKFGGYDQWWSMRPPESGHLDERPVSEQVIEQVRMTSAVIERDLKDNSIPTERIFRIKYENFCSDVWSILDDFEDFLKRHNIDVNRTCEVPRTFSQHRSIRIDEKLYEDMCRYAQNRY